MTRKEKNNRKTDQAWTTLYNRLEKDGLITQAETPRPSLRLTAFKWTAAAVILLCAYLSINYFNQTEQVIDRNLLTRQNKETITLATTLEDGSIVYLAAIAGINPELYEAASVDGAGRFKKMWHITIPGIRSTIVVLLIMNLGNILGSGFDRPFAFQNNMVMNVANVISTFVYTNGIKSLQFSLTTAVGLFQSVICVIFLLLANWISRRLGERGIW